MLSWHQFEGWNTKSLRDTSGFLRSPQEKCLVTRSNMRKHNTMWLWRSWSWLINVTFRLWIDLVGVCLADCDIGAKIWSQPANYTTMTNLILFFCGHVCDFNQVFSTAATLFACRSRGWHCSLWWHRQPSKSKITLYVTSNTLLLLCGYNLSYKSLHSGRQIAHSCSLLSSKWVLVLPTADWGSNLASFPPLSVLDSSLSCLHW